MAIAFHYQTADFSFRNQKKIKEWILLVAFIEHKEVEELGFIFCNDDYLLQLNRQFLKHQTLTDIITFDYTSQNVINAEIYISTERVRENAKDFGVNFTKELQRVIIHGVLHCCGYSDKLEKDKTLMRKKENEYLQLLDEL